MSAFLLRSIGVVRSSLRDRDAAPRQPDEGAPEAVLQLDPDVLAGVEGLRPGNEILVLTWLHEARRDVLRVHPRGDPARPLAGVFTTRSPDRPNPIGLHRVEVLAVEGARVRVRNLEAIDGTPILDVKPLLSRDAAER